MNRYFDSHFQKNIVTISPGELYTSQGQELISTVLGSCISIVLFDLEKKIGGMNHFMLAKTSGFENPDELKKPGRFGEYAIDLLIEDLIKVGASKSKLQAKVFGGGNIFNIHNGAKIGETNINFAFDYLKKKNIPVLTSNTGGNLPRKIFFDASTSKVFMKYISSAHISETNLQQKEKNYINGNV